MQTINDTPRLALRDLKISIDQVMLDYSRVRYQTNDANKKALEMIYKSLFDANNRINKLEV
jgi:hypothetical protein